MTMIEVAAASTPSVPATIAYGRSATGATSTTQSASEAAAVTCPLGQLAWSSHGGLRGAAVSDLRIWVVTLAPMKMAATASVVRAPCSHAAVTSTMSTAIANGRGPKNRTTNAA